LASRKIHSRSRSEFAHRQKRKRQFRLTAVLLIALSSLFWAWPVTKWGVSRLLDSFTDYRVRSFRVIGAQQLSAGELIELSAIHEGVPLFRVNLKSAGEKIRAHPWVQTATVLRRLPDTIELRIKEQEPIALINAETVWMVTCDGVLLPPWNSPTVCDLPLLRIPRMSATYEPGDRLRDSSACALLAQSAAARKHAPGVWSDLSEFFWERGEMRAIYQRGDVEIRLGDGTEEIGWKSLDRLLAQLQAQDRLTGVESIDLRFAGRLVVRHAENRYATQSLHTGMQRPRESL
jgi:cell division protein FtsQ